MSGPGGFSGGRVLDSHGHASRPLPHDHARSPGSTPPEWLDGKSLIPLVNGDVDEIHDEIFAEVTYHAAYEPQRAVRTARYKYMRRFDETHRGRVLAERR